MATEIELKATGDALLTLSEPLLSADEVSYLAANRRYWQGVIIPPSVPLDGLPTATDTSRRPTDQVERWSDMANVKTAITALMTISVQVDAYHGPAGRGYVLAVLINSGGVIQSKSIQVGPETWRAHDWQQEPG